MHISSIYNIYTNFIAKTMKSKERTMPEQLQGYTYIPLFLLIKLSYTSYLNNNHLILSWSSELKQHTILHYPFKKTCINKHTIPHYSNLHF